MDKKLSFEKAIDKLESIVRDLESGNMPLEESLLAFEEAVGLVKLCTDKLSDAEQKVRILTESADGSITDLPFNFENDAT